MITRRRAISAAAIGALSWRAGMTQGVSPGLKATPAPAVDTSVPDVVTRYGPFPLGNDVVCDYLRLLVPDNVIVGVLRNLGDEPVVPPWDIGLSVRDLDGIILEETFLMFDYPVLEPGVIMGFEAPFLEADLSMVDPNDIRFTGDDPFSSESSIIDEMAVATTAIESEEVIDLSVETNIEYVVRNTSELDYSGLTPALAIWDANGLYCGSGYANVFAEIPAGDAIRFETRSCCGFSNPLQYAGQGFTWQLWVTPVV